MVAVIGCGRSGTNMVLEILSGSPSLMASCPAETKNLVTACLDGDQAFLTKCDTHYFTGKQMLRWLNRYPEAKIVWTIRDPRDIAMSKLRRGAPFEMGGDNRVTADDGTVAGMMHSVEKTVSMLAMALVWHAPQVKIVRMEHALENTEGVAMDLCDWLGIRYDPSMCEFWTRMRVKVKRERYKGKDLGQIGLWKNWKGAYDGWLNGRFGMDAVFARLRPYVEMFGYE